MKETFDIKGMTCAACQANVNKAVSKLEGVKEVDVSLLANRMQVEYDASIIDQQTICNAVNAIGYQASCQNQEKTTSTQQQWQQTQQQAQKDQELSKKKLWVSIILLCILMYIAMAYMVHLPMPSILKGMENALINTILQMILASIILLIQNHFFVRGFKALFHKAPNMDSLVAIGSAASYGYALFYLFVMAYGMGHQNMEWVHKSMHSMYFDSAAMIVTLVSVGKYLETRSKAKTNDALDQLMDLAPKSATIIQNGKEVQVSSDQIQVGDIVLIRPGQRIPVDGTIIEGMGYLDQSAITGESMPVEKQVGQSVLSATMNENGTFKFRAEKVGQDSTLAQIIRLVDQASHSKAPIARIADKVAGIFVPTVIGIALITFVVWMLISHNFQMALNNAISVLVISCPCALGLATPVAIMVGTGKAAELGILLKSAQALETLQSIDTIVLDKTGTITLGKPSVQRIVTKENEESFLLLAASLEQGSAHPLAKAIIKEASRRQIKLNPCTDFKNTSGRGVKGKVQEKEIFGGNQKYMEENHIEITNEQKEVLLDMQRKGMTPLLFGQDGHVSGIVGVADTIRKESQSAIEAFKKQGLSVVMLTGDNENTANYLAQSLSLDQVISEVLPADKEKHVHDLQNQGQKVAMVGDGINDAPALVRSDVGIAIGAGTDIAMDSADIILMKDSLHDVNNAIDLSRAVIKNIKENLFWAFFYNVIGIPIAAGVFYPIFGWQLSPMFAAAAMSLSSMTVVTNALRLRKFKPKYTAKKEEVENWEEEKMKRVLKVDGMMCPHCQANVKKTLESIEGIAEVEVSLENKEATFMAEKSVSEEEIKQAIMDAGYTPLEFQ